MRRGAPCSVPLVSVYTPAPWHFLNFLPLPQGHGSLRPTPTYGFTAGTAGIAAPTAAPTRAAAGSALTRPSAAALVATIGVARRAGSPPAGPVMVRPGARGGRSGG